MEAIEFIAKCPRCNGQGHTWTPPWLPGDQPTWTASDLRSYPCQPCGGTGIYKQSKEEPRDR